jgi:hypothetical protein
MMPLLPPHCRPIPQQLRQPQPLRLPPVEDRLDEVGREAGERQQAADVGEGDALVLGEVGDRRRLNALDLAPPEVGADERKYLRLER